MADESVSGGYVLRMDTGINILNVDVADYRFSILPLQLPVIIRPSTLRFATFSLLRFHSTIYRSADPLRPKGQRRPMRGDQLLGLILPKQAQVSRLPTQ